MQSEIERQIESASGRTFRETPPKVNLPFSEADLLVGLDADGAHADALVQVSVAEMGE